MNALSSSPIPTEDLTSCVRCTVTDSSEGTEQDGEGDPYRDMLRGACLRYVFISSFVWRPTSRAPLGFPPCFLSGAERRRAGAGTQADNCWRVYFDEIRRREVSLCTAGQCAPTWQPVEVASPLAERGSGARGIAAVSSSVLPSHRMMPCSSPGTVAQSHNATRRAKRCKRSQSDSPRPPLSSVNQRDRSVAGDSPEHTHPCNFNQPPRHRRTASP
ncbi:hypothetical protein AAFF_G00269160 [Aldrovandia affinis]|uniref:Uncharacterized protein n=1 Tax=Aldrovandia affinis TaxID=143900 RepID=A0AAD7STG9_9TELE|nr:hypothetical protein AAFF_G00269160 [Aldrovandia affinis]